MTKSTKGKKNKNLISTDIRVMWSLNMERAKTNPALTGKNYTPFSHRMAEFLLGLYDLLQMNASGLIGSPSIKFNLADLDAHIGKTDQRSWVTLMRLGYVMTEGVTVEGRRGEHLKINVGTTILDKPDRIAIDRTFSGRPIGITETGFEVIKHLIYHERVFMYFPPNWNDTDPAHVGLNREANLEQMIIIRGMGKDKVETIHPYIRGLVDEPPGKSCSFIRRIYLGLYMNPETLMESLLTDQAIHPKFAMEYEKLLARPREIMNCEDISIPDQERARIINTVGVHFRMYLTTFAQVGEKILFVYVNGVPHIITQSYIDQHNLKTTDHTFGGIPMMTSAKYLTIDSIPENPYYETVAELDHEFIRRSELGGTILTNLDYQEIRRWSNAYEHLVLGTEKFVETLRRGVKSGMVNIQHILTGLENVNH